MRVSARNFLGYRRNSFKSDNFAYVNDFRRMKRVAPTTSDSQTEQQQSTIHLRLDFFLTRSFSEFPSSRKSDVALDGSVLFDVLIQTAGTRDSIFTHDFRILASILASRTPMLPFLSPTFVVIKYASSESECDSMLLSATVHRNCCRFSERNCHQRNQNPHFRETNISYVVQPTTT